MDNEKREFENKTFDNSEDVINDNVEEIIEPLTETEEEVAEAIEEAEDIFEAETEEIEETEIAYDSEYEENQYEEIPQKDKKPLLVALGIVLAVIVAILIYCVCYTNGVGSKNAVNTLPPDEVSQAGEIVKADKMNIVFENPFISMFEGKAGTKVTAMKVGDFGVSDGVLSYFIKNEALSHLYKLYQSGKVADPDNFDWNGVADEETGVTNAELIKIKTVRTVTPIIAMVSEAQKRGVVLTQEELDTIAKGIENIKTQYGDELEKSLKLAGFDNIEQFEEVQKLQKIYQNSYDAFNQDPASYMKGVKGIEKAISGDKITAKHVLIMFPEGVTADSDDEAKAETLNKAKEVLEKAKAGEDFDKLIEEYNEDPGQTKTGYTFANDGTMVQSFADAAFKTEVGKISDIVETTYGYHIIKRVDRVISFEEYTEFLTKNSKVKVNRAIYDKLVVDLKLSDYLGDLGAAK